MVLSYQKAFQFESGLSDTEEEIEHQWQFQGIKGSLATIEMDVMMNRIMLSDQYKDYFDVKD